MADVVELIAKKRRGDKLSDEEVAYFLEMSTAGVISDSQIGAMLMAMAIRGLSNHETVQLTKSCIHSGTVLEWGNETVCDKHSTGGVGDKISIPLAPALASLGMKIPMLSGRGLGLTGGTLDKLESIPGYKVELTLSELKANIEKCGVFIAAATKNICPGDKKLYAIRDVTATVDCDELIVASILSKKAAVGVKNLVLDIKVGRAALKQTIESAAALAKKMNDNASLLGMKLTCVLTEMDTPIGQCVGNSLEIKECIDIMKGVGPEEVKEMVEFIGGHLLFMQGVSKTALEGLNMIREVLQNGKALKKFSEMLTCQGVSVTDATELCYGDYDKVLKHAQHVTPILAKSTGWVLDINAESIATVVRQLGGGRLVQSQPLDYEAGVVILKTVGQQVTKGAPWLEVHHNVKLEASQEDCLSQALSLSTEKITRSTSRILQVI